MSAKPNVPEEIWLGKSEYSWRKDWKVNGWLFLATLISGAGDIMFPHQVAQWPMAVRVVIAMSPFAAILLWARCLSRWICGMDELHRRIALSVVLFSVSATFFVVMLWHRLEHAAFSNLAGADPALGSAGWDIGTVAHVFILLTFFYFLGHRIFNRRYQ